MQPTQVQIDILREPTLYHSFTWVHGGLVPTNLLKTLFDIENQAYRIGSLSSNLLKTLFDWGNQANRTVSYDFVVVQSLLTCSNYCLTEGTKPYMYMYATYTVP